MAVSAPTYADFDVRFGALAPELLSDDADVQASLTARLLFHHDQHASWATSRRQEAALLLAAHERQLSLDRASGARSSGRVLTSDSVGSWSKTYAAAAGTDAQYQQTDWGQEYLALRKRGKRPLVGGMPS
jgi:hypothetical protein